jgi:hypothetical protein
MAAHRGRFHGARKGRARGGQATGVNGRANSPRIAVTLNDVEFRRLSWLAAKRGVPVAAVIRDSIFAYLLPIAADADAANAGG